MNTATESVESLKLKLAQLKELHASGVLSSAHFDDARNTIERRIVEQVMSGVAAPTTAPASGPSATSASMPTDTPAPAAPVVPDVLPVPSPTERAAPASKPSPKLIGGLVVVVLAVAVAGYLWKGSPQGASQQADAAGATVDGKPAPHAVGTDQITAMTDKLAERLQTNPDDADGWSMLARSYSVLGRHADALKAYAKAASLRTDDPTLLADYADSMAVSKNNDLSGEPMKLVERALKLDPSNLKALYLSGTQSFNTKDYATAVKLWEKMVQVAPPGSPFAQQVLPAIAEARSLGGMPAAAPPAGASGTVAAAGGANPQTGQGGKAAATGKVIASGSVTLVPTLARQAQPEDTVFIFVRPAEGSRMPLAILRKQVKDLPLSFKLDDSLSMVPGGDLAGIKKVVVGARVSKSGNAAPQPGDLSGQSAAVATGSANVKLEIKDVVKP